MQTQSHAISKIEYTAAVEDVSVKLSIDRASGTKNALVSLTTHTHAYHELFVCVSGGLTLEVENMRITLNGGDAAVVPANLSHHKLIDDTDAVWCALGFLITANRRRSVSGLSKRLSFWCGEEALTLRGVPEFCKEIYRLRNDTSAPQDCVPALAFTLLLAKYAESLTDFSCSACALSDSDMNRVALLENLVNGEFMTELTLSGVAELLHISTRQLSRIVKKRYGMPFTRVIIHKRLETAEKLLAETDQTVDAIAKAVGFSTTAFMYREFKAKYNVTPLEYRNSRLNEQKERK